MVLLPRAMAELAFAKFIGVKSKWGCLFFNKSIVITTFYNNIEIYSQLVVLVVYICPN
jgi:hypothetical protein